MKYFFAPWRLTFIKSKKVKECVFCDALSQREDKKYKIIKRGSYCFSMLNKYPYTSGHMMVIPNRHIGDYLSLDQRELTELSLMTQEMTLVVKKAFNPNGFNIGMNIGEFAGAGIKEHIHIHIVPRWSGDNNFMPVIAGVKVHPMDLETSYKLIMDNL